MAIIIKNRPRLPFIYKGSYKSNELNLNILSTPFINSLSEGFIVVFNINII